MPKHKNIDQNVYSKHFYAMKKRMHGFIVHHFHVHYIYIFHDYYLTHVILHIQYLLTELI